MAPCDDVDELKCTGVDKTLDLKGIKSCSQVTVGCYKFPIACGKLTLDGGSCPKCSVTATGIKLECKDYSCSSDNPKTYSGGFCGDPHFSAPGGIYFDWHGVRDEVFSIISDTDFQLNARFVGERDNTEDVEHGTWIEEIAMGFKDESGATHFVSIGIDQEKEFEAADVFFFTFDGEDIPVGSGTAEYTWASPDGRATITREPHMRAQARIKIDGLFEATFNPRVESRIQLDPLGKYLDMNMESITLSRHAHGVLGQMFRPDAVERRNAVTANATGHDFLVEGKTDYYRVSSLTSADSDFNQFNLAAGVTLRNVNMIEDGAKASRKMLTSAELSAADDASVTVSARCSQETGSLVCF
ncbi:putative root cap family protein [Klebsormidium nitens]|uniref:Putative root cap family protein n=1 Tax=Klebsormidium nitens TaxID=105231 RepID=A0A1Y1IEQ9_KLENI|nr:putative root cap family protein [Klebsormidium nitens]|eukprot:GAQ88472.1 putative root cap family protein [Klebsormidium nitens]